jgi:environmental stress-induced protein Ves
MADIASDGPFSAFPGIERWFVVLAGTGVTLDFGGTARRVLAGDAPLRFDGGAAPGCRLVDGPTRDLNLMQRGGRATMRPTEAGRAWDEGFAMRGLFTALPGRWAGGGAVRKLDAHTLLWDDAATPGGWAFLPDPAHVPPATAVAGWWLGFSPRNVPIPVQI